jgi:hypothetical protein
MSANADAIVIVSEWEEFPALDLGRPNREMQHPAKLLRRTCNVCARDVTFIENSVFDPL